MKLFSLSPFTNIIKAILVFSGLAFLSSSCATQHAQYGKNVKNLAANATTDSTKISHTFYLIGDAGNAHQPHSKKILHLLNQRLQSATKDATLLFLGDNIYPIGFEADKAEDAQLKLTNQLNISKGFKGRTVFIPGNHDWYSGLDGLTRQANFVTDYLKDKKAFLPRNNCAIEDLKLHDDITLITIDSEWFLEDWDKHVGINENCAIKTREQFFDEFESLLKKNQNKTVIIAMHHPLMSNGTHGGQFSVAKQLFPLEQKIPLPVIGSIINLLRKTTGASPQDLQNKVYSDYAKRLKTLISDQDNVIVVSGHDHNLQYIKKDGVHQIISGAGSKSEAAKAVNPNDFTYGNNGYATLDIYKDGAATVRFYGSKDGKELLLFEHRILEPTKDFDTSTLDQKFPNTTKSSIYSDKMTKKSRIHNLLFGKHYRPYYSLEIEAQTATLDTLFGGLTPVRAGGGHQSKSLRLKDANGREYVMRALKKSATRFLQSVAFKDQNVAHQFEDTYAEDFILDFYTTAHPYLPFAVGHLAAPLHIPHTNPKLYFIPKHAALNTFNDNYGDELYMIEERVASSQVDVSSFGENPDEIISTLDMMEKLRKNEKHQVDETAYIRARLFDMLIGDWDRHDDQWRWARYKNQDGSIYKPIPRDRDQAFTKYDGAALWIIMSLPDLRHMKTFSEKQPNLKWLNREPYPLDLALLKTATENDWLEQAQYIQNHLSDENIHSAFEHLPKEVKDATLEKIKTNLMKRRNELKSYASDYYKVLQRTVLIVGTDKKDKFVLRRKAKNTIELQVFHNNKSEEILEYTREFNSKETKHLWVYGLDDDDDFEILGNHRSKIKIKLIGGLGEDHYKVENGKNVSIYDFNSQKNNFEVDNNAVTTLTDDYEIQLYDFQKPEYNYFTALPTLGYNPDDHVKIGANLNYTVNGFKRKPYTQKHEFQTNYYSGTNGIELIYDAHFPELFGKLDLNLIGLFTTPNFTMNYFGLGNETVNEDKVYGMNYNRVRIEQLKAGGALTKVGRHGSKLTLQAILEQYKVEATSNRFISEPNSINTSVFDNQLYANTQVKYSFINYDFHALPTLGINFSMAGNWINDLKNSNNSFLSFEGNLGFVHALDAEGTFVLATNMKGKIISNSDYQFYQAASLGGDFDLRGFRDNRFLGDAYFSQSTDLRWSLGKLRQSVAPISYGFLVGFDYGKVWIKNEDSNRWHHDFGGGLWLNAVKMFTARLTYFKSPEDRARIAFGLGFNF